MKEKVLITGASGFLGYHLIQTAIEAGLEVFAAVRKNSTVEHLSEWPLHYLFLNYEDPEEMSRQLAEHKIDYIIHSAGVTKAIRQEVYDQAKQDYAAEQYTTKSAGGYNHGQS